MQHDHASLPGFSNGLCSHDPVCSHTYEIDRAAGRRALASVRAYACVRVCVSESESEIEGVHVHAFMRARARSRVCVSVGVCECACVRACTVTRYDHRALRLAGTTQGCIKH
jgi:hypothetical protein